jgi:hypothetical protein
MWQRVRLASFVLFLCGYVALSCDDFSAFLYPERKLDEVSAADNMGTPARQRLTGRLHHADRLGCVNRDEARPNLCSFLWYAMLPYYAKEIPRNTPPEGYGFLIFVANPKSAETAEAQAGQIAHYRIDNALGGGAFLLAREAK